MGHQAWKTVWGPMLRGKFGDQAGDISMSWLWAKLRTRRQFDRDQAKEEKLWDAGVWPGNAWILDARTRKVVWELRTAATRTNVEGLPEFSGVVRLPAGTYQVNYAALFPVSRWIFTMTVIRDPSVRSIVTSPSWISATAPATTWAMGHWSCGI